MKYKVLTILFVILFTLTSCLPTSKPLIVPDGGAKIGANEVVIFGDVKKIAEIKDGNSMSYNTYKVFELSHDGKQYIIVVGGGGRIAITQK